MYKEGHEPTNISSVSTDLKYLEINSTLTEVHYGILGIQAIFLHEF